MNTSEWIQLVTLIVVLAYTIVTLKLFLQQRDQFDLSIRPWVYPDDLTFENRSDEPQFGIFFRNTGRLPAHCDIVITDGSIHLPGGLPVTLKFKKEPQPLIVYPYVQGVETRFLFYFPIDAETNEILIDGCRIQLDIAVNYRAMHESTSRQSYSFSASLEVEHFERKRGIQSTQIREVKDVAA